MKGTHSNRLLNDILTLLPAHIYWKDINGVFQGCNQEQAQSAGFSSTKEMIGKTDNEMPWKEQAQQLRDIDIRVMSEKKSFVKEELSYLIDGTLATFITKKVPWIDENNNVIGVIGVSVNITDKKKAEEYKREIEEANKIISHMKIVAAAIGHEIRTPLTSIKFATQYIKNQLQKLVLAYSDKQHQPHDVKISDRDLQLVQSKPDSIVRSADQAHAFIDLMLSNVKNLSNLDTSHYQSVDMLSVIEQSLSDYPFTEDEQRLVHNHCQHNFTFIGDRMLMKNVLTNLLKNALYYIKAANKGEIFFSTEKTATGHRLIVKDTAKGASPEVVENMFSEFFSQRELGTGLGLAFCKKIMGSFNGRISADSVEGEHMTIYCDFLAF